MNTDHLRRDLKFAFRMIARARAFATVAVVSLALGIGANTAIFSLVSGLLLSKPAVRDPSQLVELNRSYPGASYNAVSHQDLDDIRDGTSGRLSGLSAYQLFTGQIGGADGPGTVVLGELVNADYFRTLGLTMAVGRAFTDTEDRVSLASPVLVLGHRLWQTRFSSDPQLVGKTVRLNGRQYTVVGVAPDHFSSHSGGLRVDLWAPLAMQAHLSPSEPQWDNLSAIARLAPGTSLEALRTTLASVAAQHDAMRGRTDRRWHYTATSFNDVLIAPGLDGPLEAIAILLLVVVGLVLVVTCSNLAGFLLARAADRRKEMAMRLATGARRADIVRQMLIEALLLALAGGALGLLVSYRFIEALLGAKPPAPIPINVDIGIDWRVFTYTLGASVLAGLLVGLAPALRATRVAIAPTLREDSLGSTGGTGARLRSLLIAGQLALSLVLLIGAGLFVRGMRAALHVDPGFSTAPAALLTVDLRGSGYQPRQYREMYVKLREAIGAVDGAEKVAVTDRLPTTIVNSGQVVHIPGLQNDRGSDAFGVETSTISPEFFDVLGIRMRNGNPFTAAQDSGSARVAVVNRAAAERFWPGSPAVGRTLRIDSTALTIVGVAENSRDRGLNEAPRRMMYLPLLQDVPSRLIFVARGREPAPRLADAMRRSAQHVDPRLFIVDATTLEQHLGVMYFLPRMAAVLMSGFAVLALSLGCIGLYGAVSHMVARRSRELAIRMALGATTAQVIGEVVRSGMVLVASGGLAGLAVSFATAPLLRSFLFGDAVIDLTTFTVVPGLLVTVTLLASWLPARRAARLNPIDAMRAE